MVILSFCGRFCLVRLMQIQLNLGMQITVATLYFFFYHSVRICLLFLPHFSLPVGAAFCELALIGQLAHPANKPSCCT